MFRFFIVLAVISFFIIGVAKFELAQLWVAHLPSFFYETLLFLALTTCVIYGYLYKVNKPDVFVQLYLLMMAVKLMGYGGYVFFMITTDSVDAAANVVLFMALYFLFTLLEIGFLYRKIKGQGAK